MPLRYTNFFVGESSFARHMSHILCRGSSYRKKHLCYGEELLYSTISYVVFRPTSDDLTYNSILYSKQNGGFSKRQMN